MAVLLKRPERKLGRSFPSEIYSQDLKICFLKQCIQNLLFLCHEIMPQWLFALFRKTTSSFTNKVSKQVYILYVQVMVIIQNILIHQIKNMFSYWLSILCPDLYFLLLLGTH
jgi:hypothetical protein